MKLVRHALTAAFVSLALAMTALAAAPSAPASSDRSVEATTSACPGSIRLGGARFAVFRHRVSCRVARRSIKRLYRSRGRKGVPRGFRCRSTNGFRRSAGCTNSSVTRYFGFAG